METLRVGYADFWPEWKNENFIEPILSNHYKIIIDQKNPDILFHSIFGGFRETPKYKCRKILFLGENHRPGRFSTDFSISFDPHSNINFRLPLWQAFIIKKPELLSRLFNKVQHDLFERWCSFTVSNGSNFIRNSAFQQISNYKKVHSYGRFLNNSMELINYSKGRYWRDAKDEFFSQTRHKFSIAYENNAYPYYCTEKLMDSFLAGSIPIYWGDPKVVKDWNPDAFINANRNFDIVSAVKQIDQNYDQFIEMYNQPVFKPEQKDKLINNIKGFENWLITIIENG